MSSDRRARKRKTTPTTSWVNDAGVALLVGENGADGVPKTGYIDTVTGAAIQGISSGLIIFILVVIAAVAIASWGLSRTYDNARVITMVNETLYSNITAINSTIDTLTTEIETVNTTLTNEIIAVNVSLCDKVMMLEMRVDEDLAMLEMLANMTSEDFMQFLMNATQMFTELNEEVQTLNVEVAVLQDPDMWQVRVNETCTDVGGAIQSIADDGSVTCFVGFNNETGTIDASQVISGQFDDARISSSSVLQYESLFNHFNILNIGVNTHAQIDTFITNIDTTVDARIAAASIGDLADVDTTTTTPTIGDVLEWDGSDWVPGTNLVELNNTIEAQQAEIEILQAELANITAGGWIITLESTGTSVVTASSGTFFAATLNPLWYLYRATLGVMTFQYIEVDTWSTTASNPWGTDQVRYDFVGLTMQTLAGTPIYTPLPYQAVRPTFDWLDVSASPSCTIGLSGWYTDNSGNPGNLRWFFQQPTGGTCNPSVGPVGQIQPLRLTLPAAVIF